MVKQATRTRLVIGDTPVARRVCATLASHHGNHRVTHLVAPSDAQLAATLREPIEQVAVLIRDDVAALRYALAVAHLNHELPLVVTIFDRTIADQLQKLLPRAVVVSSAIAAVPSLLGPCLSTDAVAAFEEAHEQVEIRLADDGEALIEGRAPVKHVSIARRVVRWLRIDYRHQDVGTRILLKGLIGIAMILVADWAWLVLVAGHAPVAALSEAARVVATVGPGPDHAAGWYGFISATAMLATIVLTALFTAGLVDRFLEPRLVRLTGSGSVPRSGHVIVVGLGQVGFRLCEALRSQGHRLVAVERDRDAPGVALARQLKIPVIIGDGTSRHLLERLELRRCLAIAAVGSLDLDNVAVAVAVSAVSPATRVVLRAGEQEAVAETRSLLPLGVTRDVTAVGAAFVLTQLSARQRGAVVVAHNDGVRVRDDSGTYVSVALARRDECRHETDSATPRFEPPPGRVAAADVTPALP